jgi:hypothetical protein
MSLNLLRLIPTEPSWVPDPNDVDESKRLLAKMFPESTIDAVSHDQVIFIDQGGNFEEVRCPNDGSVIDTSWWGDRMDEAAAGDFADLTISAPCCNFATTLNDLDYRLPAGFARFVLTVRDWSVGGRTGLTAVELDSLQRALGHGLRQVMARY